jgi:hypothetical protein
VTAKDQPTLWDMPSVTKLAITEVSVAGASLEPGLAAQARRKSQERYTPLA